MINCTYRHRKKRFEHNNTSRYFVAGTVLFIALALFPGCASMSNQQASAVPVDPLREYINVSSIAIAPEFDEGSLPDAKILLLGKEVTDVLDETVMPIEGPRGRLNAIISILNEKVRFDTESDKYATKTAMETYKTGTGNCLSFTNLFVAMARYVGLEAGYQEVSTNPNWSREKSIIFVSKHISAYATIYTSCDSNVELVFSDDDRVMIQNGGYSHTYSSVSDALYTGREDSVTITPIPDNRAFAQYYNNIACMHLAGKDSSTAFRYFVKALEVEPNIDFVWSNMGVAYSRCNRIEAAEKAFLRALSLARASGGITELSIMNNMVKLYERSGDEKKADFFRSEVASFRKKNPYYHYVVGRSAFSDAAYKQSIKHFKAAIRKKGDEDMFYYGLALAYLKLGDLKKAEENIDKARLYAWDDQMKEYYDRILEKISRTVLN